MIKKIFAFILVLFLLGGCEILSPNQTQPVSEAIEINNDWKEIIPPTPLKSNYLIQHISLKVDQSIQQNIELDGNDPNHQTLKYNDGKSGKIEASLYDDKGEIYPLQINGKGAGILLGRKLPPRDPNKPPENKPSFPADRVYVKLRIRSEVPLQIEKIEWTGYNPK